MSVRKTGNETGTAFLGPLERVKPFKAAAPEKTICNIRSLLESFCLPLAEEPVGRQKGRFSLCLRIVNTESGEPVFQTMGKGRTEPYARASAYGEMIERIQNLAFYMMLMYPSEPETSCSARGMPFKYYPDEKILTNTALYRGAGRLFGNVANLEHYFPAKQAIGVPFRNMVTSSIEYLPVRAFQVVVGSNGMCSGNTAAEALIHGICEVFERYVLKQLFLSPRSMPDIPLNCFAGHAIHEDLVCLSQEHGCDVWIKDCSLGLRLPVLGLLVLDGHGRYAFHLGADPSPVTALERCLTEMYQGGRIFFMDAEVLKGRFREIPDSDFWKTQLHLNIRSYEGHWPPSILGQTHDTAFKGFDHPVSVSDATDLNYLFGIMKDAGWDLLIRDTSFLGFPAYHIYIPGISEMTNALDNTFVRQYLRFDEHLHVLTNPSGSIRAERQAAVQAIRHYASAAPSRQFRAADYMMHFREHPLAVMPQAALQKFLEQDDPSGQIPHIPGCFNCMSCRFINRCNYPFISTLWDRMKQAMVTGIRTQSNPLTTLTNRITLPVVEGKGNGP